MCRKKRAWSSASILLRPQIPVTGMKRRMPARRASALSRPAPTMPSTRPAAALSERRIIGASSARSPDPSTRARTDGRSRYATSSIASSTLAEGNVRFACQPQLPLSVRTANAIVPWRCEA